MFKIDLAGLTVLGWFASLPPDVAELPLSRLADLGDGTGFWPMDRQVVGFDPRTHRLAEPVPQPDALRRVVVVRPTPVPLPAEEVAAEEVAELKRRQAEAIAVVNQDAGKARARFITVAIGQEGTYIEKDREARAFQADPAPDPASYPYLSAEAEHTGQTITTIAALIVGTAAAWTPVNAQIEGLRQGALKTIRDASTPAAVATVFPIDWPAP
ncbi:hypothetical protein [Azospirillum doebereinerae]|uniref:Uncharacterized protein n=1 Tax=Azospirillum doebereinerae TaxID=92933 RepID=A0A3S0V850_9PROT|nr:hypothetical protein [Azospirillum doebereinerae]RUQ74929.1 hypothetical protein EJ913_03400 [Azospirillum doebereinerae]